jgi:hypothetical protein
MRKKGDHKLTESAYAYLLIVVLFFLILIIIDAANELTKRYRPYSWGEFIKYNDEVNRDVEMVNKSIKKIEDNYYRMKI